LLRAFLDHFGYSLESRMAARRALPDAGLRAAELSLEDLRAQRRAWKMVYEDFVRFDRRLKYNLVTILLGGLGSAAALYEAVVALIPGVDALEAVAATSETISGIAVGVTCAGLVWGFVSYRRRQEIPAMIRYCVEVLEAIETELVARAR
jgi:hypothetical protein